jgi:hypothetical protein
MLSLTTTANESYNKGSVMASSTTLQYSAISTHSLLTGTPTHIREWLMSLPQGSHANLSASPGNDKAQTTAETCGRKQLMSFAEYDHDSRSWKTSQVCLLTNTLDEYSETWPKAGLMLDGVCYPQPKWERRISEIGGSVSLPTPSTVDNGALFNTSASSGAKKRPTLGAMAKHNLWPTPDVGMGERGTTPEWKPNRPSGARATYSLNQAVMDEVETGGQLNPTWVEWLMGWPLGWTDLKPLGTGKYRQWRREHGSY